MFGGPEIIPALVRRDHAADFADGGKDIGEDSNSYPDKSLPKQNKSPIRHHGNPYSIQVFNETL